MDLTPSSPTPRKKNEKQESTVAANGHVESEPRESRRSVQRLVSPVFCIFN